LKDNFIIGLLLETLADVAFITIVRYICYSNNLSFYYYNSKEEIAIYFSLVIILHLFRMAFLSKELYLAMFLSLSTLLLVLLHMSIEMINLEYSILQLLLSDPATIMSILILLMIKIVMNLFAQFSIYLYNNFLERS
jgi:hypothetical protein